MRKILDMQVWASGEVYKDAHNALRRARLALDAYLTPSLLASPLLSKLSVTVRYVPILMPEGTRSRYPARSKLRIKEQLYDCAPQLDYDIFVNGTFEQQIDEYIRGLAESVPFLPKLGATKEQTDEFSSILAAAKSVVRANHLDQIRH